MALAVLKFDGADSGRFRFRADIGKNRFYQYAVGGEEASRSGGLKMLAEPRHVSPLVGPLEESAWAASPSKSRASCSTASTPTSS